jgi:hypothetical protein
MLRTCFLALTATFYWSKTTLVKVNLPHVPFPSKISSSASLKSSPIERPSAKVSKPTSPKSLKSVTTEWKLHENSRIRKTSPRDFKKLNKMSLKDGGVNARDQYAFRQSHDARVPFAHGHGDKSIKMPEERFTYGQQTRP